MIAGTRPKRLSWRVLPAAALLALGVLVATPVPAHAAAGLTATFSTADNGSWWLDKYVVANPTSTSITGWTIEFDLAPGVTMSNSWNGTATVSGSHVTVTNAYYNGTVADRKSVV